MAKHPRKKQKTTKASTSALRNIQPLGSQVAHLDDADKDDEERRLESLLFGTDYTPAGESSKNTLIVSDDEGEEVAPADKELQNLLDSDLFFVDDVTGNGQKLDRSEQIHFHGEESKSDGSEGSGEEEDVAPEEEGSAHGSASEEEDEEKDSAPSRAFPPKSVKHKAPAWTDSDDPTLQVSLATDKRRRKLRDALAEDVVGGRDYERRLRRQFEKINPTPQWAATARAKLQPAKAKRRRPSSLSGSELDEEDGDALPDLLSDTKGVLKVGQKSQVLPQGAIEIERLRDANLSAKAEGEVNVVQFHPSPQVPVMLTASSDRRLRLFNIDGHTNPHLQTVHIPELPITTAMFHPGGTSVLLTGRRPFYHVYDLQSGTTTRSSRGLWGTTFAGTNAAARDASMEVCAFDSSGSVLAVAGRRGRVHLVDWRAGQGQVVGTVKMNSSVKSLWWAGEQLMSLGEDTEVYLWNVGERRCVRRWKDDGGFGSGIMCGDRAGRYLAIGSRTGLVNVYGHDCASSSGPSRPKPLKTLGNLTTTITSLRFNHDSQLLAIASNTKKDHMRLIHLPSLTAFSNWPTSSTPLGHVTSVDFSAGSEYVAIGNNRGRVLLYNLRHFVSQ